VSGQETLERVFGKLEEGFYCLDLGDGTSGFVSVDSKGNWKRQSQRFENDDSSKPLAIRRFKK
jgi:hypothetical protein